MRAALPSASSSGTSWPSPNPLAMETEALPVAIALAPDLATAAALPASQALNSTSGSPATWSFAKSSNLLMRAFLVWGQARLTEQGDSVFSNLALNTQAQRRARHVFQLRHQRPVREGSVADPR